KGIEISKDFAEVKQILKQDDIVLAVKNGLYDVGFVRTGTLEDMASHGKIQMNEISVIDAVPADNSFPLVRTTDLYPEWYMMAPKETDPSLVAKVRSLLIGMAKDSPETVKAMQINGFEEPLPIDRMVDLLKAFHLPPYNK